MKVDVPLEAEFVTWQREGVLYHAVGLVQARHRRYTLGHPLDDPPKWAPEFSAWLAEHGAQIDEFMVGPPHVRLPNGEVAEKFRLRWHVPGEVAVAAQERYWQENPRDWNNLGSVAQQQAEFQAADDYADVARTAYLREHFPELTG